jgi:hydroxyacylglutathione hydrolase
MLEITPIPAFSDNYIWLFHQQGSRDAWVVDPGDAAPVIERLEKDGLELAGIVITHHHADHTGGVAGLLECFQVPVYGPSDSACGYIDHPLRDGDKLELAGIRFLVLTVPGHTMDHIAYFAPENDGCGRPVLFCGDTLFAGGCGRVFEGTVEMMHDSLMRLAGLPDNTHVYCAHEYTLANLDFAVAVEPANEELLNRLEMEQQKRERRLATVPSTIALEKATNPFLRSNIVAVAQTAQARSGKNLCEPAQIFGVIRRWKDNY